ncbi:MAG: ABC transporter permease [Acidobacteria bacterium]|nr:ABC transporter permease [Acidobacteriota bacterium]
MIAAITRVGHLITKELIELRADPRLFGIVIMAPIIQLVLLGYAATTDVHDIPILVVDDDRSAGSRQLVERFAASANFTIVDVVSGNDDVEHHLEHGTAWMALTIPAGLGTEVASGRPTTVQVIADGTDSNSTGVALGYARTVVADYSAEQSAARLPGGARAAPIDVDIRVWFNPQLESRDFMVPGIVALLLLVVTTNLSAMAIVREREVGTLEQLNVTPLARWELIVGKLLPYALIGMFDVVLVTLVSVYWFEVPFLGSFPLLFACSLMYLLSTLGLGLFVSTISQTQQQASMTATFFFLTPMIYLSGFTFPIENMPQWIQYATYAIPLRYFLVIVRGIFLKGVGVDVLWPQMAALLACGLVLITLATLRSSKRLA